ncbi:LutB/LldF family L-lactate oxidation iron-sulfur protein [Thalassospira sp. SM2505]|uniref:(Fe-S)-binding protein n=1 Tax=Thalassospira profundimaris TaxID=502049 RepID=A0A367X611_9PROT|nr:LutB/LldF family L-lactate oxidation iron-sulfur protein [Thalassospira profundimaris]RCK49118.1 (Fe-S)-binding protein [Thalassospira profundimaris]
MNVSTSPKFKENVHGALRDESLQRALGRLKSGFQEKRSAAAAKMPEFEALRDQARDIKNHTLENLDHYLLKFEENVKANGGHVHWCADAAEAREVVAKICRDKNAKSVLKGKSMISEEIGLNDFLEKQDLKVVETDLGEYIIQLRHEPPSHIIAPAIHVHKEQVADSFRETHTGRDPNRSLVEPRELLDEAREVMREHFFAADIGITGANFLIAETGTSVIVTNEGNGDLTQTLSRVHIAIASLEKVVPTLEDASSILRVLARSATGQEMSSYTTFSTGPKRDGDLDGPEEYHVILLDNGRSNMLGTEFQDMLRCIRCAACMNHCPVYGAVGGHAYGWVYPGPMGSVLSPSLIGVDEAGHLPNASTFCGKCEEVCPMRIPLPKMMRHWREREFEKHLSPSSFRYGIKTWAFFASKPKLYRAVTGIASKVLGKMSGGKGKIAKLPLAGGWTDMRDLPAPEGKTFKELWAEKQKQQGGSK